MSDYLKFFNNHSGYEDFLPTEEFIRPNVSYCKQPRHVHYNPVINYFNGFQYVDLGLPNGTLWATMNVGAQNIEDEGKYFAYGEIEGYTANEINNNVRTFDQNSYEWYNSSTNTYIKYNAERYNDGKGNTQLDIEDDCARENMGGWWRLPYSEEVSELKNFTTLTETTQNGIHGALVTSNINGNSIFFPFPSLQNSEDYLTSTFTAYSPQYPYTIVYSMSNSSSYYNGISNIYNGHICRGVVNKYLQPGLTDSNDIKNYVITCLPRLCTANNMNLEAVLTDVQNNYQVYSTQYEGLYLSTAESNYPRFYYDVKTGFIDFVRRPSIE